MDEFPHREQGKGFAPYSVDTTGGKTRADFEAASQGRSEFGETAELDKFAGGPNGIVPGEEAATAWVKLEPGNYLLICGIPDPKGVPHVAQGMIKTLTVASSAKRTAAAPQGHASSSFRFQFRDSKAVGSRNADNRGEK